MKKEEGQDEEKKPGQREFQTLTNSYLMTDPTKLNGVLPRLYNFTDYNAFSKPTDDIDIATGIPVVSPSGLPNPISGSRILRHSGTVSNPGLAWAASADNDTGSYLLGTNNPAEAVNGTLVFDWDANSIDYASGYSIFLGVTAMSGFGSGYELISSSYSYDGALRYVLTNPNAGTSAHSTMTVTASGGFDTSLFSVGAGWTLGGASGNAVANEGGVILSNIWAGGSGSAGMLFCNRTNSYIRWATNNLEKMRLLTGAAGVGALLLNATTQVGSEWLRVAGTIHATGITISGLTAGRIPYIGTSGLLTDETELQYDTTNNALLVGGVTPATARTQLYVAASGEVRIYGKSSASNAYVWMDRSGTTTDATLVFTTANNQSAEWTYGLRGSVTGGTDVTLINIAAGGEFYRCSTAGLHTYTVSNATTVPIIHLLQSSTGDAALRFAIGTTSSWAIGADNSATGDPFKIAYAASGTAALGTTDRFTIESDGEITVAQWFQVGTATDSATQGDLVAGLTGAARMFYDQSVTSLTLYDASNNADVVIHANGTSYFNAGSLGIGVTTPDKKVEILDAAAAQLRLTNTDAVDFMDVRVDSDGFAYFETSGGYLEMSNTLAAEIGFGVYNQSTNAAAGAFIAVTTGADTAGDAYYSWSNGTTSWAFGIDGSAAQDHLILAKTGIGLGNDFFNFKTDGRFVVFHNGTGTDGGNLFELCSSQNGSSLVSVTNDSSGSSAVAGFYCSADGSSPIGGAFIHTSSTYTDGSDVQANEVVLNAENNSAGLRIRTTEDTGAGYIVFMTRQSGTTMREVLRLTSTPSMVVNEDGNDCDFRVEGDTISSLLLCDASVDKVKIGGICEMSNDVTVLDSAKGIVLKDTAGTPHYWRVTVSTLGVLTTADLGTSPP